MAKSLSLVPLQDGFDAILTAPLDAATGAGGYLYLDHVPTFTFPTGLTTSIRIDTGKSTAEEIEIDQIDSVNLRCRIKTRNLNQGNGVTTTAQSHATGARVIISDSYSFWSAISAALNTLTGPLKVFSNDTARDVYFNGLGGAEEGNMCIDNGTLYVFESGAWRAKANGTDYASTRVVTAAAANNGELFRDSGNSNALTYKNTTGSSFAFIVDATGKVAAAAYDFASQTVVRAGTDATQPVNSLGVLQSKQDDFGGSGKDGAVGAGDLTITGSNDSYILKEYTSFAPGAHTVTIAPTGCILHIKVRGNLDLTGTTLAFSGKGKQGSTGGTAPLGSAGNAGAALSIDSFLAEVAATPGQGGGGGSVGGAGGGGGGSPASPYSALAGAGGTNGSPNGAVAGGIAGAASTFSARFPNSIAKALFAVHIPFHVSSGGAGGGGGGGSAGGTPGQGGAGGNGGNGGGFIIFEVAGDVIWSSTTATVAGTNGSNGSNMVTAGSNGSGGGGGGAAGCGGLFAIFYRGNLTGSPSITVSGGTKGSGGSGTASGGAGADAAAGYSLIKKVA